MLITHLKFSACELLLQVPEETNDHYTQYAVTVTMRHKALALATRT